jgi:hypothetical protein
MAEPDRKAAFMSALPWILFGCLVFYVLAYLVQTTTSSDDVFECVGMIKAVEAKHQIPRSVSVPGKTGIFCDKGVHFPSLNSYNTVTLYGVTDRVEQNAIIDTLQSLRRQTHIRDILLRFIDKENWTTWSDPATGRSGGGRGPEQPTWEVWIR